jgi:signal transduction histidine kinase
VREADGGNTPLRSQRQAYTCLRVSDTGGGIPADVRARMFEPVFTTKKMRCGTGMGLALVAAIVENHDGWIDCHSEVGHGTCFEIYLPRYDAEQDGGNRE